LAQAILHNPDVLILDEPTAGLDPKQIIETRELIKALGGEHTIVLSTHILPEVSMTCGRVVIINKGRVMAEGTPEDLTQRFAGQAAVRVDVRGEEGPVVAAIRGVEGVTSLRPLKADPGTFSVEVEAEAGRDLRADLARAVVAEGLDLLGLKEAAASLEEVFLHLTTTESGESAHMPQPAPTLEREVTA
jgi:ABC-2 type transport system ATP-binding protein